MKKIGLLILIVSPLIAQVPGGYIDQDSIIKLMPEYQTSISKVEQRGKELNDTMTMLIQGSEAITFGYLDCKEAVHSSNPHQDSVQLAQCEEQYQAAVLKHQKNITDYEAYAEESYTQLTDGLLESLYKILQEKVNVFCEKHKIHFLTDKNSLLYCPNCKDYTEDFIKYLLQK